jgi:hypothetical protein
MTRTRTILTLLSLAAIAAALTSCITEGPPKPKPQPGSVIRPAALIVSPLTRVGFDQHGNASIFLHVEFRDAAGAPVKAFGLLHVELHRPAAPGSAANPQTPALTWDADLRNPVTNALSYDEMITRTYTITLTIDDGRHTDVPEWLLHWARSEGAEAKEQAPTLVVQFTPTEGGQVLRTTYTLTR